MVDSKICTFAKKYLLEFPIVSVIVPVYNTQAYVERCLESICNQSFVSIEIIIIDDGSTDQSAKILENWQRKDARIKLVYQENGGLSKARNKGIELAKGKYICFVDSDDWVSENFIAVLMDLAYDTQADMVVCNLQKVDENKRIIKKLPQLSAFPLEFFTADGFSAFGEISWFACNKLIKTDWLKKFPFRESIYFEDIASIPNIFLQSTKIARTEEYLYQYFERSGSISRSFNEKGLDMFIAIKEVKAEYEKSNYKKDVDTWKRFVILQGFYSFLAYAARVKDPKLQNRMYDELRNLRQNENLKTIEILKYERNGKNYLLHLPLLKQVYYLYVLFFKI